MQGRVTSHLWLGLGSFSRVFSIQLQVKLSSVHLLSFFQRAQNHATRSRTPHPATFPSVPVRSPQQLSCDDMKICNSLSILPQHFYKNLLIPVIHLMQTVQLKEGKVRSNDLQKDGRRGLPGEERFQYLVREQSLCIIKAQYFHD